MNEHRTFRKGIRVEHALDGRRGTIVYVSEEMLGVRWDDSGIALPARAEDLRKMEDKRS
jgi:hypothetical protein